MAHNTGQHDASGDSVGERAANSDWLDKVIRVGLVAYGVVHLLTQACDSYSESARAGVSGSFVFIGSVPP